MGMGMPPMDDDEDESALLAELAALQVKPALTQKKAKPKQGLTFNCFKIRILSSRVSKGKLKQLDQ